MDVPVRMPEPGDPATFLVTGVLYDIGEHATVRLPGGERASVPLAEGVRVIPGDITPALVDLLEYGIARLTGLLNPVAVARLEQYERLLDCVRGFVAV